MSARAHTALVVGWHAHKNVGDDAMLQVIANSLNEQFGITTFNILASPKTVPSSGSDRYRYKPVICDTSLATVFNRWNMRRAAQDSKIVVFGGGSIFHSNKSLSWKKQLIDFLVARGDRPLLGAMGVSFGPFPDLCAERTCKTIINDMDFVVTRDTVSFDFASANCPQTRVLSGFDLAFLLDEETTPSSVAKDSKETSLGVSLCPHPEGPKASDRVLRITASAIIKLAQARTINQVKLFAFCGDRRYGDEAILQSLGKIISEKVHIKIIPYNSDPKVVSQQVACCDVFLGMRLHSQIFALLRSVPLIGINYHKKCEAFLDQMAVRPEHILALSEISPELLVDRITQRLMDKPKLAIQCDLARERTHAVLNQIGRNDSP